MIVRYDVSPMKFIEVYYPHRFDLRNDDASETAVDWCNSNLGPSGFYGMRYHQLDTSKRWVFVWSMSNDPYEEPNDAMPIPSVWFRDEKDLLWFKLSITR